MTQPFNESRRTLLRQLALAAAIVPMAAAPFSRAAAADAPLVTSDDPTAKALNYVSDVHKAADAKPGSSCATCALYQGAPGAAQGPCPLFAGKAVKATGWCKSWVKKP